MSCVEESAQAVEAVSELEESRPMLVSYTLDSNGYFRDGKAVVPGLAKLLDFTKDCKVECKYEVYNVTLLIFSTIALTNDIFQCQCQC